MTTKKDAANRYLAMRDHDGRRYRVWGTHYWGDAFEIIPAEQIPVMREACRIAGVPVHFLHMEDEEVSDATVLSPDEPLPR